MADLFHRVSMQKISGQTSGEGKDCGNPSRGNSATVCKEPAAVGILCNYQKRYTGEIIKGKSGTQG